MKARWATEIKMSYSLEIRVCECIYFKTISDHSFKYRFGLQKKLYKTLLIHCKSRYFGRSLLKVDPARSGSLLKVDPTRRASKHG